MDFGRLVRPRPNCVGPSKRGLGVDLPSWLGALVDMRGREGRSGDVPTVQTTVANLTPMR